MVFKNPLKGKSTAVKVLVIFGIALLIIAGIAVAATYLTIPSSGTVNTPPNLTGTPSSISWGTIDAGDTTPITRTVTLENTGDQATNPLKMTYSTPIGAVTWDFEDGVIPAHTQQAVNFTLTPLSNPPGGPFNFNIIISG